MDEGWWHEYRVRGISTFNFEVVIILTSQEVVELELWLPAGCCLVASSGNIRLHIDKHPALQPSK